MSEAQTPPFAVAPGQAGQTVAAVLRAHLPALSWSKVRALCSSGRVLVDGCTVDDPARRMQGGETIEIDARGRAVPEDADILYVDREVVVVDKPAGVLTVPFSEDDRDTLVHRVQRTLRKRLGPGPSLRVVQRLDKDTSGVLVFARSRRAERALQDQFRKHSVERVYVGLALGDVVARTHRSLLVPNRGDGLRGSFRGPKPPGEAREAVTHVAVEQRYRVPAPLHSGAALCLTLVSCRLETGRQHQIRIHLAEDGHPLVGERVYVRDYRGGFVQGYVPPQGRPLLHAAQLGFLHPVDESLRRFESPWPQDLRVLLAALDPAG